MHTQTAIPEIHSNGSRVVHDGYSPGVSWGAVLAGATAAAAISFILLMLGVGLGLSAVSPYSYNSGAAIAISTILWLMFMQLAASGVGGYMAGRLRVKWASVHTDEVHFRDTAHGMLAWAVATLITIAFLAGGVRAVLSGAIDAGAGVGSAVAPALSAAGSELGARAGNTAGASNPMDYFSDMLLRTDPAAGSTDGNPANTANATNAQRTEVNRILVNSVGAGKLSAEDRTYLAQVIAKRSGISQADAERRVDDIYARVSKLAADAKEAADQARKTAAHSALWAFVALLLGAFTASLAATFGGRQRDHARVLLRNP